MLEYASAALTFMNIILDFISEFNTTKVTHELNHTMKRLNLNSISKQEHFFYESYAMNKNVFFCKRTTTQLSTYMKSCILSLVKEVNPLEISDVDN